MPDPKTAAEAMYPNGVNTSLGNQDPDKVLATFSGNHQGALLWGEQKHRDAYLQKYGYEKTLGVVESALKQNANLKDAKGDQGDWWRELEQFRADMLAKQGS